ncbi:MAG: DUF885 domain-containing protein [Acidobacteria bacterium]|nr:DUF885 domain-containing protein [Acidobacteriota bacterium]
MNRTRILFRLVVAIVAIGGTVATASALSAANPVDEVARLQDLFDREWEFRLKSSPLLATSVGRNEWNHLLPDVSAAALERQAQATRDFLVELAAIDRLTLERVDQVNYDIFRRQLELRVASHEFSEYQIPLNADSGFHSNFARLGNNMPFATVEDYENYIARLRLFAGYAGQQIENMQAGLERGMVLPKVVLRGLEGTISSHIIDRAEDSVFWAPFAKFPRLFTDDERARLSESGAKAILEGIVPGYAAFLEFMTEEYIPGSRDSLGASELPNGSDYYQYTIRKFTTLDLTAAEIHEIGRSEVERIRAEMEAVIEAVEFDGSFDEFLTFLRTDPRFYVDTPEALLKEAAWIAKRMDGKLPALFKTLPRLPYTVEPVPDYLAPKYTTGRYVDPPQGSVEPGRYWVNTYNLPARPLYNLEALSLHEAVPGHHLQISLNRELEGLPDFRRFSYISAFGEGWGLYSEWLGLEAGFYTDPYSNFGRLTYEMWRACRLVVDTGIHAMGWTREEVIDFLASNTALPLHEVETETDRYISWPGQALSYKLGELEIKKLRRRAEERLGDRFDVREFHDAVLLSGSVPLPVLEENIDRFIEAKTRTVAPLD